MLTDDSVLMFIMYSTIAGSAYAYTATYVAQYIAWWYLCTMVVNFPNSYIYLAPHWKPIAVI